MLPPYAKRAATHPVTAELRVYVGAQVWEHCKIRNGYGPAILLPPGEPFDKYTWPVHGREVLVMQTGSYDESINPFCAYLVQAGAVVVRIIYGNGTAFAAYRAEGSDE